jgi:hypothetical protein
VRRSSSIGVLGNPGRKVRTVMGANRKTTYRIEQRRAKYQLALNELRWRSRERFALRL